MINYSKLNDPLFHDKYFNEILQDINSVTSTVVLSDLLKTLSIKLDYKEVDPNDADIILEAIKRRNKILLSDSYKTSNKFSSKKNYDNWEKENRTETYYPYPTSDNDGGTTNSQVQTDEKVLSLSPTSVSSRRGTVSIILIISSIAITTAMYTLLWIAHATR